MNVIETLFDSEKVLKIKLQKLKDLLQEEKMKKKANVEEIPNPGDEQYHKNLMKSQNFEINPNDYKLEDQLSDKTVSNESSSSEEVKIDPADIQVSLEKDIEMATIDKEGEVIKFDNAPWREFDFYMMTENDFDTRLKRTILKLREARIKEAFDDIGAETKETHEKNCHDNSVRYDSDPD